MQSQGALGAVHAMACAVPDTLQPLPSFFLIGPPRTGTSWLHEVLSKHTLLPASTERDPLFRYSLSSRLAVVPGSLPQGLAAPFDGGSCTHLLRFAESA